MIEYTGQTRADFNFFLPVSLRISDMDFNNHLNQSAYYEFFDTGVIRYLQQFTRAYERETTMPTVCVENGCRYRREIKFGDTVEVAVRVVRIGTSSVQFALAVFTEGYDDPNAIANFVLVFVDPVTRRPTPIPQKLKDAMN